MIKNQTFPRGCLLLERLGEDPEVGLAELPRVDVHVHRALAELERRQRLVSLTVSWLRPSGENFQIQRFSTTRAEKLTYFSF